jgi:hypothetical protein
MIDEVDWMKGINGLLSAFPMLLIGRVLKADIKPLQRTSGATIYAVCYRRRGFRETTSPATQKRMATKDPMAVAAA